MRAAVFYGGRDIRVEDIPAPIPGSDEVLIAVRAAGICGSDLHRYRGVDPWGAASGPQRYGHEIAGIIVDSGQRVAIEPAQLRGRGSSAGFSELDVAPAENVFPLPDDVPFAAGALTDVYACALHALHRAPLDADCITVIGTGPIGIAVGQLARAVYGKRVQMIGRRPEMVQRAMELGAADDVRGDGGVIFETVGNCVGDAVDLAAPEATIIILGACEGDVAVPYRIANAKEITLRWSNGYAREEFRDALGIIASRRVDAASLVTHRFPLERIGDAFAAADDKKTSGAIKVVIEP